MTTLTVTRRGQVTLGKAVLTAARQQGSRRGLHGVLASKTNGARLSIKEIEEATAEAGADAGLSGG